MEKGEVSALCENLFNLTLSFLRLPFYKPGDHLNIKINIRKSEEGLESRKQSNRGNRVLAISGQTG